MTQRDNATMRSLSSIWKSACYLLLFVLGLEMVPWMALAAPTISVRNVHFEVNGELVRIFYDLGGDADVLYRVGLVMKRESDPKFLYRPIHVSGDLGSIVFPGEKRRITWDFLKDYPEGLKGEDFYFEVEVEAPETEGMSPLVWIGGGAALLGGLLVVLLSKGSDTPPVKTEPVFPQPPGRPQ